MDSTDFGQDRQFHQKKEHLTRAYAAIESQLGTLANGRVRVAVSDLDEKGHVMLGLFAEVDFKKGDPVTEYGGALEDADKARESEDKEAHSHTMRVPESNYVRNGKLFSAAFPIHGADVKGLYELEMEYAPKDRTSIEPVATNEALNTYIRTEGIGYMANEEDKPNMLIKRYPWHKHGTSPMKLVLTANTDIRAGTELTIKYNMHVDREG